MDGTGRELSLYASNSKPLGFGSDSLEISYLGGRDTLGFGGQRGTETLVIGGNLEDEMKHDFRRSLMHNSEPCS